MTAKNKPTALWFGLQSPPPPTSDLGAVTRTTTTLRPSRQFRTTTSRDHGALPFPIPTDLLFEGWVGVRGLSLWNCTNLHELSRADLPMPTPHADQNFTIDPLRDKNHQTSQRTVFADNIAVYQQDQGRPAVVEEQGGPHQDPWRAQDGVGPAAHPEDSFLWYQAEQDVSDESISKFARPQPPLEIARMSIIMEGKWGADGKRGRQS